MNGKYLVFCLLAVSVNAGGADASLDLFDPRYPVSFFFRETESDAASQKVPYAAWSAHYSTLHGVMGKMLDEERLGISANQEYYRRFKQEHPDQAVLLHANGCFRKPKADLSAYHDGHWLYFNGAKVLGDIPAAAKGEKTTIKVSDPSLFVPFPYREANAIPEDVGLCRLGADGKPDWNHAEQVRLMAVDEKNGTITVERGALGSSPKSFRGGKAYAAAHSAFTWGKANTLWQFNMATTCPRDAAGKNAGDVWSDELIAAMRPGGAIDFVDGVQFDVPFNHPQLAGKNRLADCNADGVGDDGFVDGAPVFAVGYDRFLQRLRQGIPDIIIMADGGEKRHQRSLRWLNGIEIEGWPKLGDAELMRWSNGLNHLLFWSTRAAAPVFNYGVLKFRDDMTGAVLVSPSLLRIDTAGPIMADAASPGSCTVDLKTYGPIRDELLGGTLGKTGWLGRPLATARHLGLETPDLLDGCGRKVDATLLRMLSSEDATFKATKDGLVVCANDPNARSFSFRLRLKDFPGGDLLMAATLTAQPEPGYPEGHYRQMGVVTQQELKQKKRFAGTESYMNAVPFNATFYHRNLGAGTVDLLFTCDGAQPVTLGDLHLHAAPDCMVREFENGAILANPSHAEQPFDCRKLFPGKSYRRIQATPGQDAGINNGQAVKGTVAVGAKDALFLIRQ